MSDILDYLLTRRSVQAAFLQAPGPSEDQIKQMLTAAARVPDHKKLEPWRFIRFDQEASKAFGKILAERVGELGVDVSEARLEVERQRLLRAPFVVAVVSSPNRAAPVPEWEQVMSVGAVCMNLVHAAHACGFAAQWLTEWYAFDVEILKRLGLTDGERVAGFIHVGTPSVDPTDRPRPDLSDIVSYWEV
ncbi:nitroreductase family protein [Cohaesibacter celericrescens]|uniref:Putative NAD(P)H nitroreductase n=1 Tax=Cohaesibacter celericrescens TaxID=2067669 RepID=A0A2N5XW47_9HYPH|nr:nitroreductase [Cohaesibacter celericrescens]PLW78710.1 nitroreductase [Cohaesibacter celericrescens]